MNDFFVKIKNKLKSHHSFKKINPHVHWQNLLYFFALIIILLIFFSLYLLFEIKNQQIFNATSTPAIPPSLINENLYNKVMKSLTPKQGDGAIPFTDPSLYKVEI